MSKQAGQSTQDGKPLSIASLSTLGEPDPANITKQDLLQSICFDKQGKYLCVGDRGGRIIVFQKIIEDGNIDYDYLTEFQSHETAFDPLNSQQIPEKVNVIEWINKFSSSSPQLLSANDKLIKLWKIENRKEKKYESCKKLLQKGKLVLPRSKVVNEALDPRCRLLYKYGHEYHINSLSLSPDGENFISADDLRVNLWNIEDNRTVYNMLDMKPKSIEELDEVITHCEYHPANPSTFLYTTSKGVLHICDIREQSSFQGGSTIKYEVGAGLKKNVFSDLINSLSSGKFVKSTPHMVATRDYLTVKLWDIRQNNNMHISQIQVCDYLEKNLVNLYEEDSIYDKFFMDMSPCSNQIVTGAYNKSSHIVDLAGQNNITLQANFDVKRGKVVGKVRKYGQNKKLPPLEGMGTVDFKKKILSGCWHPVDNIVALAFRNCIFLYYAK